MSHRKHERQRDKTPVNTKSPRLKEKMVKEFIRKTRKGRGALEQIKENYRKHERGLHGDKTHNRK